MKKISFTIFIFMFGLLITKATTVNGKINIYFWDNDDYYGERPSSLVIPVGDGNDRNEPTYYINIDLNDSGVSLKKTSQLAIYTYNVNLELMNSDPYLYFRANSFEEPIGYEYRAILSGGAIKDSGGSIDIFLIKNTLVTRTITVNYPCDNNRDEYQRWFYGYLEPDIEEAEDERYWVDIDNSSSKERKDTFVDTEAIPGTFTTDRTSPDYFKKINYTLVDMHKENNREVEITNDGYDYNVTICIHPETVEIPINVTWDDEDNKNNVRPDSIEISAYDQNGEFEQTFTIDNTWTINKELYKNMKYSNGKAIDYTFKVKAIDNYEFTVTKNDDETYIVKGKYVGNQVSKKQEEINEDTEKVEENPSTSDNIFKYIVLSIICLSSITLIIKYLSKEKE